MSTFFWVVSTFNLPLQAGKPASVLLIISNDHLNLMISGGINGFL